MATPERLGHRSALDGVRGLALALVVVAHVGHTRSGGGTGVTVFFVLSGFLITTLLMEERDRSGSVRLRGFYLRRARRLLPALGAVLLIATLVAIASGRAAAYLPRTLAAATYLSNWLCIRWDPTHLVPLSHTWSLAVEEQFYLVWPVVLIVACRRGGERLLAYIIVIGALASTGARFLIWHTPKDYADLYRTYQRIYLGTDTRGAALLIGAGAALLWRRGVRMSPRAAVAGLLVILGVTLGVAQQSSTWLLGGLVATELGAAAVVLAAASGPLRVLSLRPLTHLGEVSYGFYLIHVPLIWALGEVGNLRWQVLVVALSWALAVVSYHLVEMPFRRPSHVPGGVPQERLRSGRR